MGYLTSQPDILRKPEDVVDDGVYILQAPELIDEGETIPFLVVEGKCYVLDIGVPMPGWPPGVMLKGPYK